MKPLRMTSCSEVGGSVVADGTAAQVPAPASALRAETSSLIAKSRGLPNLTEFSSSSRETMSASAVLMAATILSRWRSRFAWLAAPRGPSGSHRLLVIGLPSRSR